MTKRLLRRSSLPDMTLHRMEDDLLDHSWYEQLFVTTIADVEAYVGRWTAFEEAVGGLERVTGPVQDS
jgi:hypothetical protein